MSNYRIDSEEREIMLTELQLCQMAVDNSSERIWESGGIILAGAMATLALMLQQLSGSELSAAIVTSIFAAGALLILWIWQEMIKRQNELQRVAFARMRHLEDRLGIEIEQQLKGYKGKSAPFFLSDSTTTEMLRLISTIVMAGWLVVVAWRWLIYAGLLD